MVVISVNLAQIQADTSMGSNGSLDSTQLLTGHTDHDDENPLDLKRWHLVSSAVPCQWEVLVIVQVSFTSNFYNVYDMSCFLIKKTKLEGKMRIHSIHPSNLADI